MIFYHKAVRDRIPEIIEQEGKKAAVQILEPAEFAAALHRKLQEEVQEYLQSEAVEELADLLEVVYALAGLQGTSPEALEALRLEKRARRGGFEKRLLLVGVEDGRGQ